MSILEAIRSLFCESYVKSQGAGAVNRDDGGGYRCPILFGISLGFSLGELALLLVKGSCRGGFVKYLT